VCHSVLISTACLTDWKILKFKGHLALKKRFLQLIQNFFHGYIKV
jgi:hypothetical protein